MNARRGMTLIELLLALVLLASLSVVGVDWTVTATRISTDAGDAVRWNTAARVALDRIDEDLDSGDFLLAAEKPAPRVLVGDGTVTLVTRARTSRRATYSLDQSSGSLSRTVHGNGGSARILLGDVMRFECSAVLVPDEDDPEAPPTTAILTVTIDRGTSHTFSRKHVIPAEWLP